MSDLTLTAPTSLPQGCDDWRTPPWLYRWACDRWGTPAVDLAASEANHLAPLWYGRGSPFGEDGLRADVGMELAWCNPPFSDIGPWVELCSRRPSIMLLPANRTEQPWWGLAVACATEIVWLRPRVAYIDPLGAGRSSPAFASVLLLFGLLRGERRYEQLHVADRGGLI